MTDNRICLVAGVLYILLYTPYLQRMNMNYKQWMDLIIAFFPMLCVLFGIQYFVGK
jgi:hypothetical protein